MSSESDTSPANTFRFYHYEPNVPAAAIFAVIFFVSSLWHTFQLFRYRTWYFLPLVIAAYLEGAGYVLRIVSGHNMTALGPYIITTLFILVAPTLMAASIYIILGRIMVFVAGEHHSVIKVQRLTKTFVWGDVLSLFLQASGGGLMAAQSSSMSNIGKNVIVGGLFIQIIFFGLFIIVSFIWHSRINREPTPQSKQMLEEPNGKFSWLTLLRVLYVTSLFIMIRSIFRVVEYIGGREGYLQTHEVFYYCLDALMMVPVVFAYNVVHPSFVIPLRKATAGFSAVPLRQAAV